MGNLWQHQLTEFWFSCFLTSTTITLWAHALTSLRARRLVYPSLSTCSGSDSPISYKVGPECALFINACELRSVRTSTKVWTLLFTYSCGLYIHWRCEYPRLSFDVFHFYYLFCRFRVSLFVVRVRWGLWSVLLFIWRDFVNYSTESCELCINASVLCRAV